MVLSINSEVEYAGVGMPLAANASTNYTYTISALYKNAETGAPLSVIQLGRISQFVPFQFDHRSIVDSQQVSLARVFVPIRRFQDIALQSQFSANNFELARALSVPSAQKSPLYEAPRPPYIATTFSPSGFFLGRASTFVVDMKLLGLASEIVPGTLVLSWAGTRLSGYSTAGSKFTIPVTTQMVSSCSTSPFLHFNDQFLISLTATVAFKIDVRLRALDNTTETFDRSALASLPIVDASNILTDPQMGPVSIFSQANTLQASFKLELGSASSGGTSTASKVASSTVKWGFSLEIGYELPPDRSPTAFIEIKGNVDIADKFRIAALLGASVSFEREDCRWMQAKRLFWGGISLSIVWSPIPPPVETILNALERVGVKASIEMSVTVGLTTTITWLPKHKWQANCFWQVGSWKACPPINVRPYVEGRVTAYIGVVNVAYLSGEVWAKIEVDLNLNPSPQINWLRLNIGGKIEGRILGFGASYNMEYGLCLWQRSGITCGAKRALASPGSYFLDAKLTTQPSHVIAPGPRLASDYSVIAAYVEVDAAPTMGVHTQAGLVMVVWTSRTVMDDAVTFSQLEFALQNSSSESGSDAGRLPWFVSDERSDWRELSPSIAPVDSGFIMAFQRVENSSASLAGATLGPNADGVLSLSLLVDNVIAAARSTRLYVASFDISSGWSVPTPITDFGLPSSVFFPQDVSFGKEWTPYFLAAYALYDFNGTVGLHASLVSVADSAFSSPFLFGAMTQFPRDLSVASYGIHHAVAYTAKITPSASEPIPEELSPEAASISGFQLITWPDPSDPSSARATATYAFVPEGLCGSVSLPVVFFWPRDRSVSVPTNISLFDGNVVFAYVCNLTKIVFTTYNPQLNQFDFSAPIDVRLFSLEVPRPPDKLLICSQRNTHISSMSLAHTSTDIVLTFYEKPLSSASAVKPGYVLVRLPIQQGELISLSAAVSGEKSRIERQTWTESTLRSAFISDTELKIVSLEACPPVNYQAPANVTELISIPAATYKIISARIDLSEGRNDIPVNITCEYPRFVGENSLWSAVQVLCFSPVGVENATLSLWSGEVPTAETFVIQQINVSLYANNPTPLSFRFNHDLLIGTALRVDSNTVGPKLFFFGPQLQSELEIVEYESSFSGSSRFVKMDLAVRNKGLAAPPSATVRIFVQSFEGVARGELLKQITLQDVSALRVGLSQGYEFVISELSAPGVYVLRVTVNSYSDDTSAEGAWEVEFRVLPLLSISLLPCNLELVNGNIRISNYSGDIDGYLAFALSNQSLAGSALLQSSERTLTISANQQLSLRDAAVLVLPQAEFAPAQEMLNLGFGILPARASICPAQYAVLDLGVQSTVALTPGDDSFAIIRVPGAKKGSVLVVSLADSQIAVIISDAGHVSSASSTIGVRGVGGACAFPFERDYAASIFFITLSISSGPSRSVSVLSTIGDRYSISTDDAAAFLQPSKWSFLEIDVGIVTDVNARAQLTVEGDHADSNVIVSYSTFSVVSTGVRRRAADVDARVFNKTIQVEETIDLGGGNFTEVLVDTTQVVTQWALALPVSHRGVLYAAIWPGSSVGGRLRIRTSLPSNRTSLVSFTSDVVVCSDSFADTNVVVRSHWSSVEGTVVLSASVPDHDSGSFDRALVSFFVDTACSLSSGVLSSSIWTRSGRSFSTEGQCTISHYVYSGSWSQLGLCFPNGVASGRVQRNFILSRDASQVFSSQTSFRTEISAPASFNVPLSEVVKSVRSNSHQNVTAVRCAVNSSSGFAELYLLAYTPLPWRMASGSRDLGRSVAVEVGSRCGSIAALSGICVQSVTITFPVSELSTCAIRRSIVLPSVDFVCAGSSCGTPPPAEALATIDLDTGSRLCPFFSSDLPIVQALVVVGPTANSGWDLTPVGSVPSTVADIFIYVSILASRGDHLDRAVVTSLQLSKYAVLLPGADISSPTNSSESISGEPCGRINNASAMHFCFRVRGDAQSTLAAAWGTGAFRVGAAVELSLISSAGVISNVAFDAETSSGVTPGSNGPQFSTTLSAGAIAGIVLAALVVLTILGVIGFVVYPRARRLYHRLTRSPPSSTNVELEETNKRPNEPAKEAEEREDAKKSKPPSRSRTPPSLRATSSRSDSDAAESPSILEESSSAKDASGSQASPSITSEISSSNDSTESSN